MILSEKGSGMLRLGLMMIILTGILVALGYVVGLLFGSPELFTLGAFVLAIVFNAVSYFASDKIVISMTKAKVVSEAEQPTLHRIVSSLALSAGLPKPRVAIVESPVPNAFATGRGPSNSVVAVTSGLMRAINEDELEGVLSHEISHIKHRDVLVGTVAATIAGAISYLALVGRFGAYSSNSRNSSAAGLALVLSFLAPLAAFLVQTAVSRGREYEADSEGATLSKKPLSLASALEKIERVARSGAQIRTNPSTSPLWIINPFRADEMVSLFSTHPPTAKRIERLREIAGRMGSLK
jgi:heat shock protein HtpX